MYSVDTEVVLHQCEMGAKVTILILPGEKGTGQETIQREQFHNVAFIFFNLWSNET